MDAEAGLRVAYFALNLIGGFCVLIIAVMLIVERRRRKEGAWFATFTIILSRLMSTIISCLLLFSGAIDRNSTPGTGAVCIAQSGLHTAVPPLLSYTILSYVIITTFLACRYPFANHVTAFQAGKITFLALPFIFFAVVAVTSSLVAKAIPSRVRAGIFYCYLDDITLERFSNISSICALTASIAFVMLAALIARNKKPDLHGVAPALLCWGLYSAAWIGLFTTQCFKTFMAADVLSAADGIIVSLFLAIQRPTIIACIAGIDHSAPMEEGDEATENTSATPQPAAINISDTVDVSVSDPRQDLSSATKMRVLALALGLGSSSRVELPESGNSREEMQASKSQGILAHPYAVDENHASFSSLKSIQYGMALGHPSQDVSRNVTPAFKNGSSEEDAMERSADIIISDRTSTPSRTEKIQMEDLIGRGRASRLLTTLRVHGSTPSVIESALPSTMDDKSSSRSRPVSALRQHPLPSSIHLDSRSQAPTPAHAYHSSPYLLRRALTPSRPYTSSDMLSEHSHPSEPATGTESSGRILAESIEDSIQSWPDVSRTGSSRAHHHESTSERGTLGRRFPISTPLRTSMEDSTGHSVSLSAGRESSPSPLRLGESITSAITTAPIGRHSQQQDPGPRSSADIV